MISETHFLISENSFLISQNLGTDSRIRVSTSRKHFLMSGNSVLMSGNHFLSRKMDGGTSKNSPRTSPQPPIISKSAFSMSAGKESIAKNGVLMAKTRRPAIRPGNETSTSRLPFPHSAFCIRHFIFPPSLPTITDPPLTIHYLACPSRQNPLWSDSILNMMAADDWKYWNSAT